MSVAEVQAPDDLIVEGGEPEPVEPAPVPEPVVADVEPEPEPEPEPVPAADAPPPAPRKRSLVQELQEERAARRAAEALLKEHTAAVTEGRVIVKPPTPAADLHAERLTAVAKQLNFVKPDGTPDLESASKVDQYVQSTVRQQIAPLQNASLETRANTNMATIWADAAKAGVPEAALAHVRAEFEAVMAQPNAAAMIADPNVAKTIYQKGIGAAFEAGKLAGAPKAPGPAPVPAEVTGRRPSQQTVKLSPALEKVYRDNGLDPAKGYTATKAPVADERGAYSMEE